MFTTDVAEEVREAYWTWLNEALLGAVEDQHEGVFRDLTGDAVAVITGIVDRHRTDRSDVN